MKLVKMIINKMKRIKLLYYKLKFKKKFQFDNIRIDLKTKIKIISGEIKIGSKTYLRSENFFYHAGMPFPTTLMVDSKDATIKIGKSCNLNGAYIHAKKYISIGNNTLIASGTNIIDSNGHTLKQYNGKRMKDIPKPISIGDNVWIGLNCVILKGTIIGDNCVIGANSVVKGVFEKNSLIIGNPAKKLKEIET